MDIILLILLIVLGLLNIKTDEFDRVDYWCLYIIAFCAVLEDVLAHVIV